MSKALTLNTLFKRCERPFTEKNEYGLNFESECHFAKQQLLKNDFALNTAKGDQNSLLHSIQNVAAIGISLNPALAEAYLVPRDKKICLDISYRGMVKLAVDAGAIEWAKAVLVYEGDTFKWRGPAEAPVHEADVFDSDRVDASNPLKNLKGGYCIAKLTSGDVMVETMSAAEIIAVKESSKAKNGPWNGKWSGEMAKKTLIKRASKSWPPGNRARLDKAIHVLNEHEGLEEDTPIDEQAIEAFMELVAAGDGIGLLLFADKWGEKNKDAAFNAAPSGEKTLLKNDVRELEKAAIQQIDTYEDLIKGAIESDDVVALNELLDELDENERVLVDKRLTDIQHRQIANMQEAA